MVDASKIQERMEVVGSDGQHVGLVDRVEGEQIKLAKDDPAAKGVHRYLALGKVASVGDQVWLSVPALEALGRVQGAISNKAVKATD